jgi:membrane dipeptidase
MGRRKPSLTPEEARALHHEALVIDSQQPPITSGALFTPRMQQLVSEYARLGRTRAEIQPLLEAMIVRELRDSAEARESYLNLWRRAGVTVACGTFSGPGPISQAFEQAVRRIANAHAIVDLLTDHLVLVREAADIERAHREGKHGIVIDFQDTLAFGDDLDRIELFHNLGLRMVQLTYNLQNLVGDGCTERYQGGLTTFGLEVVRRLNDLRILVDISHCSEQVGWDALAVSTAPVVVSHSAAKALSGHPRAKSDELARAVAERGGYFGVVVVPGFLSAHPHVTLEDFVRHVEHMVDVCGIDPCRYRNGQDGATEFPDWIAHRVPARNASDTTRKLRLDRFPTRGAPLDARLSDRGLRNIRRLAEPDRRARPSGLHRRGTPQAARAQLLTRFPRGRRLNSIP